MDYEKKYKESFERAKKVNRGEANDREPGTSLCEYIFPELKKSGDERIRKEIIQFIKKRDRSGCDYDYDQWIAWLEKQDNLPVTININKMVSDYANNNECGNEGFGKPVNCMIRAYRQGLTDAISTLNLEKQGEKDCTDSIKSDFKAEDWYVSKVDGKIHNIHYSDKIGPKFKVGDWVVQKNLGVYNIVEVCESWYEVISYNDGMRYSIGFDKENDCHIWTIQDAKDGDVLASNNGVIILVKESRDSSWGYRLSYHCAVLYDGTFEPREFHVNPEKFFPATKKQRDTLFAKMKEAGYEWDAEEKELKKIEDEPKNYKQQIMSEMTDLIIDYIKQKPAWSEEDEEMIDEIIDYMKPMPIFFESTKGKSGKEYTKEFIKNATKWLRTLKDRVQLQPKQEWSEEDDAYLTECINAIATKDGWPFEEKRKTMHWLDSLKERIQN